MDELAALWSRQEAGWSAMVRGSGWTADRLTFGVRGFVRITEVVHHSRLGWNVHFHAPLLLKDAVDEFALTDFEDRMSARFRNGVQSAGGAASAMGQDLRLVRPGTEGRLAAYLAKGTTAWRSGDSRAPLSILADLKDSGEGIDLWKEFNVAVTSKKRRRLSPSQSLENLMKLRP